MLEFRTQGFQGYAVKYSPFFDNRIAVAAAANYGLVGNGRLYVLELTAHGIVPLKVYTNLCYKLVLRKMLITNSQLSYTRRPLRCDSF